MNQLFYNIAGKIVHQIRREKRTTISVVIVRGKRNIKQNRNWFYFNFFFSLFNARVLYCFNKFKTEKFKRAFEGWNRPVCHLFGLSKFLEFHPWTVKRSVTAPMSSLLFRCFSLGRKIVFLLGLVGRVSVCIHCFREIQYFSPRFQF